MIDLDRFVHLVCTRCGYRSPAMSPESAPVQMLTCLNCWAMNDPRFVTTEPGWPAGGMGDAMNGEPKRLRRLRMKCLAERDRWYHAWLSGDMNDYMLATKAGAANFARYRHWQRMAHEMERRIHAKA